MGSLHAKLSRAIGTAVADYGMIEEGDVVAVAVSGGKDSLTLLDILLSMRKRSPVKFDLVAVTVDQGYEGFRWPVMERHFRALGVPYHIESTRISDLIEDHKTPGSTWCSLCARLRRGVLYGLASEKGWTKIALGHHADDLIETHLLSQLFNGVVQSMPPILRSRDEGHVVIRPMCYVWERQVVAYTKERGFPVICCACPACRDLTLKRQRVKALLQELEESWPGVKQSLLGAQRRLKLTQLMDPRFLPLGSAARLAGEAASSPYWGIAQNSGDVQEEPEDGFEPRAGDSRGGSGPLIEIRPPASGSASPRFPAHGTDLGADPDRGGRAALQGAGSPVQPVHEQHHASGKDHWIPPLAEGGSASSHPVRPSSCGAMCGCGPLT